MKEGLINRRWSLTLPDQIADWDAITGWEIERIESMHKNLKWGDVLIEVGAEHGWMAALYAREFVGGSNMILVEPSIEMWRNIWLTWEYNHLDPPWYMWPGFASDVTRLDDGEIWSKCYGWPAGAIGYDECPAMAYKSIEREYTLPEASLDAIVSYATNRKVRGISIDVEGAEMKVLRGAHRLLMDHRPLVWVSVHDGSQNGDRNMLLEDYGASVDDIMGIFDDAGYTTHWLGYDHEHHLFAYPSERIVSL